MDRWCIGDEDGGGGELLEMLSCGILKMKIKHIEHPSSAVSSAAPRYSIPLPLPRNIFRVSLRHSSVS